MGCAYRTSKCFYWRSIALDFLSDCKDVSCFLLWLSVPFSEHTRPALIRTLAQDWWNGANIDSIWARQIAPPSCVLSLSLSFTLAQFPSNLPLPLSLTFPFIPFLLLPFFSLPLCPRLSVSLSSLLQASQALRTVMSPPLLSWVRSPHRDQSVAFSFSILHRLN